MPVQTGKSVLAGMAAQLAPAYAEHKDDEVKQIGQMPDNAKGVARLTECKVGIYEKGDFVGKPFFYASGNAVEGKDSSGTDVTGLSTKIGPIPICDTPKRKNKDGSPRTVSDYYGDVMQHLMRLGASPADLAPAKIEATMAALKKVKPYFRFRTWSSGTQELEDRGGKLYVVQKGKTVGGPFANEKQARAKFPYLGQEPLINHSWEGIVLDYVEKEPAGGVVDATPSTNGDGGHEEEPNADPENFAGTSGDGGEVTESAAAPDATDLEALAAEADSLQADLDTDDEAAVDHFNSLIDPIKEAALAAGIEQDAIDNAENWEALVVDIRAAEGGDGGGDEPPAWEPEKGGVCHYQPVDPKTKKPQVNPKTKKPHLIEVEVISINAKAGTAVLRNTADKKLIKDAKLDQLSE